MIHSSAEIYTMAIGMLQVHLSTLRETHASFGLGCFSFDVEVGKKTVGTALITGLHVQDGKVISIANLMVTPNGMSTSTLDVSDMVDKAETVGDEEVAPAKAGAD